MTEALTGAPIPGVLVVGVDNFVTGHKKNLDDVLKINPDERLQFQFVEGDLRDPEVCKKVVKDVDIVLGEAGEPDEADVGNADVEGGGDALREDGGIVARRTTA